MSKSNSDKRNIIVIYVLHETKHGVCMQQEALGLKEIQISAPVYCCTYQKRTQKKKEILLL